MAGSISFKQECPVCEALVPIREAKLIGKKIKCPKCGATFVVKEPPPEEDDEDKEEKEEGITTKPAKAGKPGERSAVAEKKPGKGGRKATQDGEAGGKKKKASKQKNSKTLVIGVGLAVLAVAVLVAGGIYLFKSPAPPKPPVVVRKPPVGTEPSGDTKPENKGTSTKEEKAGLIDPSNLVPADATALFAINVEALARSGVWQTVFTTQGAFREKPFEEVFGFPLLEGSKGISRIITAVQGSNGWVFSIVRTLHPVEEPELVTHLRLIEQKTEDGKKYYLVGRQFDSLGNLLLKASRPRKDFALCILDPQTLIFADQERLERFLGEWPKLKEKAAAPSKDAAAKTSDSFRMVKPELKNILDLVSRADQPWLVTLAGDSTWCFGAIKPILAAMIRQAGQQLGQVLAKPPPGMNPEQIKQLKEMFRDPQAILDKAEADLRVNIPSLGLSVANLTAELLTMTLALECKEDALAATFVREAQPLLAGADNAGLRFASAGKVVTVAVNRPMKQDEFRGLTSDLAKTFVAAHDEADLANTAPRYHQLAAALMKYVDKNKHFPRGTLVRKSASDIDPDFRLPDQRVSWLAELLPYLPDASFGPLAIDPNKEWYSGGNLRPARMIVPHFALRAADGNYHRINYRAQPGGPFGATQFVGMAGIGEEAARYRPGDPAVKDKIGIFGYDRETKLEDIPKERRDKVIAVIQVPPTFPAPWMAGGGATVRGTLENRLDPQCVQQFLCEINDNGTVTRGTYAIMADGKVRLIRETIDPDLFLKMCAIQGPEMIDKFDELVPIVTEEQLARPNAGPNPEKAK